MPDKLTVQYEEARSQLAEKSKEICRLEKMVWRKKTGGADCEW